MYYFLISSECLFYGRQLKALKLFEAKVCISFQQVALVYKCERLLWLDKYPFFQNTLK